MPSAYWGTGQALSLLLPETGQEWLLLSVYFVIFFSLLIHDRKNLQHFSVRKWFALLLLIVLALVASQLLPISLPSFFLPLAPEDSVRFSVSLLSAVPTLLAGALLGPGAALLVGMSMGLGNALSRSHQVVDLFHYAFAAWFAAYLMGLRYYGRLYRVLRNTVFSGTVSQGAIALMSGFTEFLLSSDAGLLGRFDLALAAMLYSIIPLLVEGFAGGLIVAAILRAISSRRSSDPLEPAPGQRSLEHYLLTNQVLFGGTVLVIVVAASVVVTTFISTRLVVAEIAAEANLSTALMAGFETEVENNLLEFASNEDASKADGSSLNRMMQDAGHYDQVIIIGDDKQVTAAFPDLEPEGDLTTEEMTAVSDALLHDNSSLVVDSGTNDEPHLSVVVPVAGAEAGEKAVLVGRAKRNSLAKTLEGLHVGERGLSGAIVDLQGVPLVEVGNGDHPWPGIADSGVKPVFVADDYGGETLLEENSVGERQLVYMAPSGNRPWRVAVSVPYEAVLLQALSVAVPLILALVVVAGVFYARLANYSRHLSGSINHLIEASRNISEAGPIVPYASIDRQDEVGELSRALFDMQRGVKRRLDELTLLLSVSRDSSTSFELAESLPVVIHGAMRGTGASGVRCLVLNPAGGRPISFAEGPAADSMDLFDNQLMRMLRQGDILALGAPQAITERLEIEPAADPGIKALYALPLQVEGKFLGVLAVGFRDRRTFSKSDVTLLQSLGRQASVLVQKSYLYTYAEGGRRRLAAVLASTSEAVIVTDQSSRIVVINRAMEDAFDIEMRHVANRLVADVIDSAVLVDALTDSDSRKRDLEVAGKDGRTYLANTSIIINHEKKALGRVAVLHDVTNLKAVDRLKSEFIDNVSHDLRTPLTVLNGYASVLSMMDDLTPDQRLYVDKIMSSVERMIELVETLLDLGRIESGVDVVFDDVDIASLLQDIADEHWLYAHDSGIRLHVNAAQNLPIMRCDPNLVRQAVRNLLMNGFKYAPNSGDMTLAVRLEGHEIWISVRDRGPGIDKKDQMHLFEKFYRVKRHGAGDAKGSGLGLAIVKSIAERHGGHAWCESEPAKGSTFYISLPL
ncbi:MAG: ATP-binding protein [Candidatus Promineifilaceae bacterium]